MVIVTPCPGTITLTHGNSLFIFSINLSKCTLLDIWWERIIEVVKVNRLRFQPLNKLQGVFVQVGPSLEGDGQHIYIIGIVFGFVHVQTAHVQYFLAFGFNMKNKCLTFGVPAGLSQYLSQVAKIYKHTGVNQRRIFCRQAEFKYCPVKGGYTDGPG